MSNKILDKAIELSWPKLPKSERWKYSYKNKKGRPTKKFQAAYRKAWGKKVSMKKAANCDRAAATVCRAAGVEKIPSGNEAQIKYKPKNMIRKAYKNRKPIDVSKPGDIIIYRKKNGKRHTCIRGENCIYEAAHEKTYFHRNGSLKKLKVTRPKVVILRAK